MYEYYRLKDDGAQWKCEECKNRFPHTKVILIPISGQFGPPARWKLLCLECVCEDWMANARCVGTK